MTNDATRANGEAVPKTNRRTALALTGVGLAGIFANPAAAKGACIIQVPSGFGDRLTAALAELKTALIEKHPGCEIQANRVTPEEPGEYREAILIYALDASQRQPVAMPEPEHPWDRAHRLMRELEVALAEGDGAFSGPGSKWFATIHPANSKVECSYFSNIAAHERRKRSVSVQLQKVLDAHRAAREAFGDACDATDETLMKAKGKKVTKAAERRWNKLSRLEENALTAVCAFRPHGDADARAKAQYLKPFHRMGGLIDEQVLALIEAGARS